MSKILAVSRIKKSVVEREKRGLVPEEALGLGSGQVSDALKELVVIWAAKGPSYRDVRDRLAGLFGSQILSHGKIRQLLIKPSGRLKETFAKDGWQTN